MCVSMARSRRATAPRHRRGSPRAAGGDARPADGRATLVPGARQDLRLRPRAAQGRRRPRDGRAVRRRPRLLVHGRGQGVDGLRPGLPVVHDAALERLQRRAAPRARPRPAHRRRAPRGRHGRLAGEGAEAARPDVPRGARHALPDDAGNTPEGYPWLSTTRRCHGRIHRQQGRLPQAPAPHRGTGAGRAEDGRQRHVLHRHPDPGQRHHQGAAGRQPRAARGPRRALRRRRRPRVRRGRRRPRSARRPTPSPGSCAADREPTLRTPPHPPTPTHRPRRHR